MVEVNNELELFFEYYKHALEQIKGKHRAIEFEDELGNTFEIGHMLFAIAIGYYNKNSFPIVVSDEIYKKIQVPEYYHGFRDIEHAGSFLADYNSHYGRGNVVHGYYLTNEMHEAVGYTVPDEHKYDFWQFIHRSKKRVLKTKPVVTSIASNKELIFVSRFIQDSINNYETMEDYKNRVQQMESKLKKRYYNAYSILSSYDKIEEIKAFISKKKKEISAHVGYVKSERNVLDGFIDEFLDNKAVLALYFGFDAVRVDFDNSILAVVDKSKHIVSESEAKRILALTDGYKDAVLNYDENFVVENDKYALFDEKLAEKMK